MKERGGGGGTNMSFFSTRNLTFISWCVPTCACTHKKQCPQVPIAVISKGFMAWQINFISISSFKSCDNYLRCYIVLSVPNYTWLCHKSICSLQTSYDHLLKKIKLKGACHSLIWTQYIECINL